MSHPLLTAPLGPALLRLAGPTTLIMAVQIAVALAETWFLSRLGTASLAGAALVVPYVVLMHNMAAGGMGAAVAAAMARALGGNHLGKARALMPQALLLGLAIALVFTLFGWLAAPALYRAMGGRDAVLAEALAFGNLWAAAAPLVWTNFFLVAVLRGAGDAVTPARISLGLSAIYLPLSGALMLGTDLGIAGLPLAAIMSNGASIALLVRALRRGALGIVPSFAAWPPQPHLMMEMLRTGIPGSVTTIAAAATALAVTGLIGQCGTAALAGWGIAIRFEFMLAPIAFGIGTGATTLVGIATGADDWRRAVRAAWTAGLAAFVLIGATAWTVALLPEAWSRLFSDAPDVIAASVAALTRTAPFYCLFGMGLTLNFASQGAGRMAGPVAGSLLRLATAALGGSWALQAYGLEGVFWAVGASLTVYGTVIGGSLWLRPWRPR